MDMLDFAGADISLNRILGDAMLRHPVLSVGQGLPRLSGMRSDPFTAACGTAMMYSNDFPPLEIPIRRRRPVPQAPLVESPRAPRRRAPA